MPLASNLVDIIKKHNTDEALNLTAGLWDTEMEELIQLVNANPKIVNLDLSSNNFTYRTLTLLTQLKYVHTLNVSRQNDLEDLTVKTLANCVQFKSIDFSGNWGISPAGAKVLLEETKQEKLILNDTSISPEMRTLILERAKENKNFNRLNKTSVKKEITPSVPSQSSQSLFSKPLEEEKKEKSSPSLHKSDDERKEIHPDKRINRNSKK